MSSRPYTEVPGTIVNRPRTHIVSNLLLALRIIGWLLAMAIALAASSTSVVYAYRYGITLAASEPEPWLTGLALAVADVVKIGLPATIVALWARAHRGSARYAGCSFCDASRPVALGISFDHHD